MVKKSQQSSEEDKDAGAAQLADAVKESAQQIWLAGLGAFSKAQEEGGKVFETLVREGGAIQRRTQQAAEGKLSDATSRMASMASELSNKATGQWDKLEGIFEERVSRAMKKLGVPTAAEVEALSTRVEELTRKLERLQAGGGGGERSAARAGGARKVAAQRPASKTAAKRPSARKAAG